MEKVNGGTSAARCQRMLARWAGRGAGDTRLWSRYKKNCQ